MKFVKIFLSVRPKFRREFGNFAVVEDSYPSWRRVELMEFNKMLPDITRDLTFAQDKNADCHQTRRWFAKVLQNNLSYDEKTRGLSVVQSYEILAQNEAITKHSIRLARLMGWCLEILHKSMKVKKGTEEYFDQARVLDAILQRMLWLYFRGEMYFLPVLNLFQTASHNMIMGHALDAEMHWDAALDNFTMNRYRSLTKYKTAYHTFAMPVLLALHMANVNDEEIHRQATAIALEIGQFYQIQRDFVNFEKNISSCDISKGKCTWLCCVALQRATYYQRKIMEECYGKEDIDSVNRVKDLYNEIGIPSTFKIYEERSYNLLLTQVQQCSSELPHVLFFKLMDRFFIKP